MPKVIDEKHTGTFRLLILDEKIEIGNHNSVKIRNKNFFLTNVYDLPCAIAIKCSQSEPAFINETIDF